MSRSLAAISASALLLGLGVVAFAASGPAAAERLDGRRVMEELDERQRTEGRYAEGLMTVEDKGRVREKEWRQWTAGWGAEARSLVQFLEPAEVRGVGLLIIGHAEVANEQWFYTPAIDRHRRIARVEKSTRFLGTHYTYEDMEPRDIDDDEYERLDDADLDGRTCYRVEARPRPHTESQYSRVIFWVGQDPLVVMRIDAYVKGELRRVFQGSDVRTVDGIVSAHRWVVEDLEREGRTTLVLRNLRYHLALDDRLFTREAMRLLHSPP